MPRGYIAVICCILTLVLLPARYVGMELTTSEQAYLQKLGKVTVCVDPDWAGKDRVCSLAQ